jgi:signal transduction histidine kinase/ActR/RegA family two-component response regulator
VQAAALRYLEEAVSPDTAEVRMRITAFAAIAATFTLVVGPVVASLWFALSVLMVWIGPRWLHGPARRHVADRIWARRALLYIAFSYTVAGSLPLAATLSGGVWGLVNGEFLLFALTLYANANARKSWPAYLASAIPLGAYLLALAALGLRLDPALRGAAALAIGSVFLLINGASLHRRQAAAAIAVEEARDRAEAATAAKSAFVAMVSHELRTPISAMLAGAAEIGRLTVNPTIRDRATLITDAGRMMRSLLNDLLDLAKLEAGRMSVEAAPFELKRTLRDTVSFWRPEARKRGLVFRLQGAHGLPRRAVGDSTRLRQILNNLLSNALKFTHEGAITLRIAVREGEGDRFDLVCEVIDTGPGMTAAQLGRLFHPFEQLTPAVGRTEGGTGLGLSISRELARVMGGELSAASAPGEGATFRLSLPLARAAVVEDEPAAKPKAKAKGRPRKLKVLIADDHAVNRRAFGLILAAADIGATEAADGREALAALARTRFDLVLMDLNMPGMNGLEAVRELRATPGPNQTVRVIALTASTSPDEVAQALEAGMDAFLAKPVEPSELLAAIDEALTAGEPRARHAA